MSSLNVKDALSYLDLVKVQFSDHPDVYNRFLDIMKDFKSQAIDTPGVIERVSFLFQGNAALVQGFNTFLPPGYRIDCSADTSVITVTTPTGMTTFQGAVGMPKAFANAATPVTAHSPAALPHRPYPHSPPVSHAMPSARLSELHSEPAPSSLHGYHAQLPRTVPGYHPQQPPVPSAPSTDGLAHLTNGLVTSDVPLHPSAAAPTPEKPVQGPLEFNRAINYVNKIKQRFNSTPDTYKQFLEILQAYQRGSRPIQKVYAEITVLFNNDKDLLDEFGQFLPDNTPTPAAGDRGGLIAGVPGSPSPVIDPLTQEIPHRVHARAVDSARPPANKNKKRTASEVGLAHDPVAITEAPSKRPNVKRNRVEVAPSPTVHPDEMVLPLPPEEPVYGPSSDATWYPAEAVFGMPVDDASSESKEKLLASLGEVALFDRIKRHIDSKAGYTEFLKVLQLFSLDVIDTHLLVDQAALFIGDQPEIFGQFCRMAGFDQGKYDWLTKAPPGLANIPATKRDLINPPLYKAYGPSYRRLPRFESNLSCSGRDALCWSVLNDSFLSVPLLSSETDGFVHHETNPYERAMFRSEEERHEFDHHIELNHRTIEHLQPLVSRIETMSKKERERLRLPADLGAASPTIHERVVKKVYGPEAGKEVLVAMADFPAVTLPVVLARLRATDKVWRAHQQDWNKIWRTVDSRNFYKSLDHQGASFKANDKRATTSKAFMAEIESERTQQLAKLEVMYGQFRAESHEQGKRNCPPRAWPCYHHAVRMEDKDVFGDVIKMCISHLDRTTGYSRPDTKRIESFVRAFGPLLFDLDVADVEAWTTPLWLDDDDGEDGDDKGGDPQIVRGRVLPGQSVEPFSSFNPSSSPSSTPGARALDSWMRFGGHSEFKSAADADLPSDIDSVFFYANQQLFVFIKLFETMYTRLAALKRAAVERAEVYPSRQRVNPVAVALNLQDPSTGPGAVVGALACAADENPERQTGLFLHPQHYYRTLLEMCERLFEGEIDQSSFEEAARFMFDIHAYPIFTVDKVIGSLVKAAHALVMDQRSIALIELARSFQDQTRKAAKTLRADPDNERAKVDWYRCHIDQRKASEGILPPDEQLIKIVWQPSGSLLTFHLLGREDLTLPPETTSEHSKLLYYLATYASWYPTEGLPRPATARLLSRNLALAGTVKSRRHARDVGGQTSAAGAQDYVSYASQHGLEGVIAPRSFRLRFKQGQHDLMVRHHLLERRDPDERPNASLNRKESRLAAILAERIASLHPRDSSPGQSARQNQDQMGVDASA